MAKVKINQKEYNIKYSLRALFIFETITQKPFELKSLLDNYVLYYSMLLASNKDCDLKWDEFIDALDADPTILTNIEETVTEKNEMDKLFEEEGEETDSGDKKK